MRNLRSSTSAPARRVIAGHGRMRPAPAPVAAPARPAPMRRPDPSDREGWIAYAMSQGLSRYDAEGVDQVDLVRLYEVDDD